MSEPADTGRDDPDGDPLEAEDVPDALRPILDRLADGQPVDWSAPARGLESIEPPLLRALHQIATLDAARRAAEATAAAAVDGTAPPERWRHLIVLEPLGEGRFGSVSRAFDTVLQIDVALKLSAASREQPLDASAILAEARLLAKVHHPNVVRIYGVDEVDGRAGIWMEFVRGRTLDATVRSGPLSEQDALEIGIQLSQALAAVHGVNVLHGDIKAHNVIRREDGTVVLVDFGAGRPLSASTPHGTDVAGTLAYLAPEVMRGAGRSPASDVYSLGVLLFYLVTGRYPIAAEHLDAAREMHDRQQAVRIRDLRPTLTHGFARAVERATAVDPGARPASARALEAELRAARRRAPAAPIAAAVGLVLATAVGVWSFVVPTSPASRPPAASQGAGPGPGPAGPVPDARGDARFVIEATFHRVGSTGMREPLGQGQTIHVGDELQLSIRSSTPMHVYVINEDENGEAYLLYPLANRVPHNPLPANEEVTLPGGQNWQVTSAGGREHFVVIASPERREDLEDAFRVLPGPTEDGPPRPEPGTAQWRGVGGLTPAPTGPGTRYSERFPEPLAGREETSGLWGRRLTLLNPPER